MATTTAHERRRTARQRHQDELAACPGHEVLAILSRKWVTLIVEALAAGPLRHAEVARVVPGATQKMLTESLRRLERDGLVERTVIAEVPVRVDYRLTAVGEELARLQAPILTWGRTHAGAIHDARARFDRR